ncbi:MAG: hypothetical protein CL938_05295 [Deltaproteobacteria bacterium]|nr:hypothetical protein [Deltaproteobacteria bacterium]
MGRKRHTPEQIMRKLREAEVALAHDQTTAEVARKRSITEQTYYRWRQEFAGGARSLIPNPRPRLTRGASPVFGPAGCAYSGAASRISVQRCPIRSRHRCSRRGLQSESLSSARVSITQSVHQSYISCVTSYSWCLTPSRSMLHSTQGTPSRLSTALISVSVSMSSRTGLLLGPKSSRVWGQRAKSRS